MALNNSESAKTAAIPTYVANGAFTKVYGTGSARLDHQRQPAALGDRAGAVDRGLQVGSADPAVERGAADLAEHPAGRRRRSNSRMQVSANVGGSSFNEVTFYAKTGSGGWKPIGTDDTRPYRVFHDVSSIEDGKPVAYRAVVRDNAGHTRVSAGSGRSSRRPSSPSSCRPKAPACSARSRSGSLADPERATHVVRIQRQPERRRLADGARPTARRRSTVYYDDLSDVPVGTAIQYRAILREPDGTRVVSAVRTVNRAAPGPLVTSVTMAGSACSRDRLPGRLGPGLRGQPPDLRHQRRAVEGDLHASGR